MTNNPAQAEAQQPSDGLVEELERLLLEMRLVGLSLPGDPAWPIEQARKQAANHQFDELCRKHADRILAALKARTSPETVELLSDEDLRWVAESKDVGTCRARIKAAFTHLSNTPDQGSDQHG